MYKPHNKLDIPPKKEIEDLYKNKNMSMSEISEYYNISIPTVRKWLRYYNINVEPNKKKRPLQISESTHDILTDQNKLLDVLNSHKTKKKCYEFLNISESTLRKYCNIHDIKYCCFEKKWVLEFNHDKIKSELIELYVNQEKSIRIISEELKLAPKTIEYYLDYYDIRKRTKQESQSISAKKYVQNNPELFKPLLNNKDLFISEFNKLAKLGYNQTRIAKEWNVGISNIYYAIERHECRNDLIRVICRSSPEKEIFEFCQKHINYDIEYNRKILSPYEIDIYIPELKIGIEYNGLYWHSERFCKSKHHIYEKYQMALENNITLINIFEDEWLERQNQIENYLLSKIKKSANIIYARNCDIKKIDIEIAKDFINQNHIQEVYRIKYAYGLYYNNELVACMSFNHHHRNSNNSDIVLQRLCFKYDTTVVGGASKLLKFAISEDLNIYDNIISWSDNRFSEGNVYKQLNFKLDHEYGPDYSYVKGCKRISKQSMRKKKIGCPDNITEKEYCESLNFYRIWDCGKKRWKFEIKENPNI